MNRTCPVLTGGDPDAVGATTLIPVGAVEPLASMAKLRAACGAAPKHVLAAWLALMVHVPIATKVTVAPFVPPVVHTAGVVDA